MTRTALITGITGQDGGYLTQLLLDRGYEVHGMIRPTSLLNDSLAFTLANSPEGAGRVHFHRADLTDTSSLSAMLEGSRPDEVYHLAGQSHVQISFDLPEYTGETTGLGTLRLLELVRRSDRTVRFYNAATSELFGESSESPQDENTPLNPVNPYAAAKLYSYSLVRTYRRAYGLHASNGILFNHESPYRGESFVTRKIARAAAEISLGLRRDVALGNLDARRDWGFAGDYVEAMYLMVQADTPGDYVVATGESHSVREFCEIAFSHVGLDYREYVHQDPEFFRPTDITETRGDAGKARRCLGWAPRVRFEDLVRMLVDAELAGSKEGRPTQEPSAPERR